MAAAIRRYLDENLFPRIAVQLRRRGIDAVTVHEGIVFGEDTTHKIGDWVNALDLLCAVYAPEEMANHIEYI